MYFEHTVIVLRESTALLTNGAKLEGSEWLFHYTLSQDLKQGNKET